MQRFRYSDLHVSFTPGFTQRLMHTNKKKKTTVRIFPQSLHRSVVVQGIFFLHRIDIDSLLSFDVFPLSCSFAAYPDM